MWHPILELLDRFMQGKAIGRSKKDLESIHDIKIKSLKIQGHCYYYFLSPVGYKCRYEIVHPRLYGSLLELEEALVSK